MYFVVIQSKLELAPPTLVLVTVTTVLLPPVDHQEVKGEWEATPIHQGEMISLTHTKSVGGRGRSVQP